MRFLHGGNIYETQIEHIQKNRKILDFSANINPLGIPERVRHAVVDALDLAVHYPDPVCRKLKSALAEYYGLSQDFIICGNGGADLIYRLVYALRPGRALLTAPTFAEYEESLKQTGTELCFYEMRETLEVEADILEQMDVLASEAGIAALEETEYKKKAIELVSRERSYLKAGLEKLGVKVWDGQADYLFFRIPGVEDLCERLLPYGILIRHCDNYRGLDSTYYRVAVKDHEANLKLLRVMGQVLMTEKTTGESNP